MSSLCWHCSALIYSSEKPFCGTGIRLISHKEGHYQTTQTAKQSTPNRSAPDLQPVYSFSSPSEAHSRDSSVDCAPSSLWVAQWKSGRGSRDGSLREGQQKIIRDTEKVLCLVPTNVNVSASLYISTVAILVPLGIGPYSRLHPGSPEPNPFC